MNPVTKLKLLQHELDELRIKRAEMRQRQAKESAALDDAITQLGNKISSLIAVLPD